MTGLTAGYLLTKAGEKCLLIERQNEPGGLCQSCTLDSVVFDLGPHVFFHRNGEKPEELIMDAIDDLELIERRFRFAISHQGELYSFPPTLWDILGYPWNYKKEMLLGLLNMGSKVDCDPRSAKYELCEKSGLSFYRNLFEGMLWKKTLMMGENLHRDWTVRVDRSADNKKEPFIGTSGVGFLRRMFNALFKPVCYLYPVGGFHDLPDRLIDTFTKNGGMAKFGIQELAIEKTRNEINYVVACGERWPVKNLIWTGSVNTLNSLLGETELPELNYINVIIVMLTYNAKTVVERPYVYVYYPNESTAFNRIYYPQSIIRNGDGAGIEGVCLEINTLCREDEIDAQELVNQCAADLERLGIFNKADLRLSEVKFLSQTLPVYDLEYEKRLDAAYAGVRKYRNLFSVGRLGGYFFCLTPSAVSQGIKAAEAVLARR